MSTGKLRSSADIARSIQLSRPARELLAADPSPPTFLKQLVERGLYPDTLRLLAAAQSPRQAVWWAALCVWDGIGELGSHADQAAVRAAVDWVMSPTPEHADAAARAAKAAGPRSPAGFVARAAAAKKPIHVAKLAAGAILITAGRSGDPSAAYRQYLSIGLDVERGQNPLPQAQGGTA